MIQDWENSRCRGPRQKIILKNGEALLETAEPGSLREKIHSEVKTRICLEMYSIKTSDSLVQA